MGRLVRGSMQDYLEIGDDFALVKTTPPAVMVGMPLHDARVLTTYGVTVTAVKPADQPWTMATPDTVLHDGATILVRAPRTRSKPSANSSKPLFASPGASAPGNDRY